MRLGGRPRKPNLHVQVIDPKRLPMFQEDSIDYAALKPIIIKKPEGVQMLPDVSSSSETLLRDIDRAITQIQMWYEYIPDIEQAYTTNVLTKSEEYKRIFKNLDDIKELMADKKSDIRHILQILSQIYSDVASLNEKIGLLFKAVNVKEMPDGSLYARELVKVDMGEIKKYQRYILDPFHKPPLVHVMEYMGGKYYTMYKLKHLEGDSMEYDGHTEHEEEEIPPTYTYYSTFELNGKDDTVQSWLASHGYKYDYVREGSRDEQWNDKYRLEYERELERKQKSVEAAIKRALNALSGVSLGSEFLLYENISKLWEPYHPTTDSDKGIKDVIPPTVDKPNPPPVIVDASEMTEKQLQEFLYGKVISYADLIALGLLPEGFAAGHEFETISGEQAFIIINLVNERNTK